MLPFLCNLTDFLSMPAFLSFISSYLAVDSMHLNCGGKREKVAGLKMVGMEVKKEDKEDPRPPQDLGWRGSMDTGASHLGRQQVGGWEKPKTSLDGLS